MRPLRLHLKGFTAFREPAEIDFTKFDVFAISGLTGSGKSSLLDAMTYALYGRVERVGDRVGQLVSQGQPRMAVTLDFEVGHDRYRVTRSTPAARGATKILLERQEDGEWVQAGEGADRVKEAEKTLVRAIGMTYDGFTRSVLLPQGKFAELLVGDAKKRRDILTELLGLSLFRRMAERAGTIGKEASVRAQERALTLDREYADATPDALKVARAASKDAEKRERALAAAAEQMAEILGRWQEAKRSADELEACAIEAARAAEQALAIEEEMGRLGEALERAAEEVSVRDASLKACREGLERARAALSEADATLGSGRALADGRLAVHRMAETRQAYRSTEVDLARASAAEVSLEKALRAASADLARRREVLAAREAAAGAAEAALEDARHADLVATVSAGLKAGDPCPVCGHSLEEVPNRPAGSSLAKATKARQAAVSAVEGARAAVSEAEHVVEAARRKVEANAAEQQRLSAAAAEHRSTLAEGEAVLENLLGAPLPDDPLAEIERRLAEWERLDRAERDLDRMTAEAATTALKAEQDRDVVLAAIERLRDRLATGHGALFDRAARAGAGRVTAPSISPPGEEADPAALRLHAAELATGLRTFAEALAGEVAERGTLEQRLLREASVTVSPLVEPANSLDELARRVQEAVRAATAAAATTAAAARELAARAQRRKELALEVVQLEDRARLFKSLALELRADRLVAFLQAEALQVLAAAGSERLASMSEDRYRLVCRDDEFLVVDTWNGDEERSVRTLSGGETFLASLALALALAEHVRSLSVTDRARLDSLFLDEGFGTLDPEQLRTVVDAIEQLAGDGRLVGVITHVPELAEQFPRIEVRKDRLGSRLEVVP